MYGTSNRHNRFATVKTKPVCTIPESASSEVKEASVCVACVDPIRIRGEPKPATYIKVSSDGTVSSKIVRPQPKSRFSSFQFPAPPTKTKTNDDIPNVLNIMANSPTFDEEALMEAISISRAIDEPSFTEPIKVVDAPAEVTPFTEPIKVVDAPAEVTPFTEPIKVIDPPLENTVQVTPFTEPIKVVDPPVENTVQVTPFTEPIKVVDPPVEVTPFTEPIKVVDPPVEETPVETPVKVTPFTEPIKVVDPPAEETSAIEVIPDGIYTPYFNDELFTTQECRTEVKEGKINMTVELAGILSVEPKIYVFGDLKSEAVPPPLLLAFKSEDSPISGTVEGSWTNEDGVPVLLLKNYKDDQGDEMSFYDIDLPVTFTIIQA